MVALLEFNLVNLRFQMNHHLVVGFKKALKRTFINGIVLRTDWTELIDHNQDIDDRLQDLEAQLESVQQSLDEVKGMLK